MLTTKDRTFKTHLAVSLDDLVPQDNFYRKVEAKIDLSFVRDLVKDCYSSHMGRPSIDPVVFFKLQLIMFFEGIRSERLLMDMVNLNLAYRWYIGYDLDESVPNHSSLSKIRDRYGLVVFQRFFEKIVEVCVEAGLVWGKELYFDGTKVHANAAMTSMVPRWYWQAQQHLSQLFNEQPESEVPGKPIATRLVEKYDGTRLTTSVRKPTYNRQTDVWVNPNDPDASPMSRFIGDVAKMGYHTHYVVDGGKSRIILAALVTPASIMDNQPMLDLTRWVRFRWQLMPRIAVGDTKYGTLYNITGLEQDGIKAYLPRTDLSQRNSFFTIDDFTYDAERDLFVCPQDHELTLWSRRTSEQTYVYRANATICNACPIKSQCTDSKSGRHLRRSFFQDHIDQATSYYDTEAYKKAMRKRQVWVEPLFGEGKQWHQMRKFRLRGLHKVNIQGLLIAAGQNIKRLLTFKKPRHRFAPIGSVAALPLPSQALVSAFFST
jgi:transposase